MLVFVHAAATTTPSTGTLVVETPTGPITYEGERFGGHVLDLGAGDIAWLGQDVVHAVEVMNGLEGGAALTTLLASAPPPACYANDVVALMLGAEDPFGSTVVAPMDSFLLCRGYLLVGTIPSTLPGAGTPLDLVARVLVNDVQLADSDGDGLGDLLEADIGTCAINDGTCIWSSNSKDTDRDGLPDGEEAIGYLHGPTGEAIPFAYLGASPRRKDVFVEFDWDSAGATSLSPDKAEEIVQIYADDPPGRAKNPDFSGGIALHLDIGQDSCQGSPPICRTDWGDWGGAEGVQWLAGFEATSDAELSEARQGRFRWAGLRPLSGSGETDRWRFHCYNEYVRQCSHELGHSLGLHHGGDDSIDIKPNYPSLMSYTYPNWELYERQFSAGELLDIDPVAADETAGAGDGAEYLTGVLSPAETVPTAWDFNDYTATSGNEIDWNRDGLISGPTEKVVARPLLGATKWVARQPHRSHDGSLGMAFTSRAPIAVLGGSLYVTYLPFGTTGLEVRKLTSTLDPCTSPGTPTGCCEVDPSTFNDPCTSWGPASTLTVPGTAIEGHDAARAFDSGLGDVIVVAYAAKDIGGAWKFYAIAFDAAMTVVATTSASAQYMAIGQEADPGIEIVWASPELHAFYRSTANTIRGVRFDNMLAFVSDDELTLEGVPLETHQIPAAALETIASGDTYLVTTNSDATMRMVSYSGIDTALVQRSATPLGSAGATPYFGSQSFDNGRRPALIHQTAVEPWAWELWHMKADGGGNQPLYRSLSTEPPGSTDHQFRYPSRTSCDLAFAVDLAWYQGELLAACTMANFLVLEPFAHGSFPMVYRDTDDFGSMAARMCEYLTCDHGLEALCVPPGGSCDCAGIESVSCEGY